MCCFNCEVCKWLDILFILDKDDKLLCLVFYNFFVLVNWGY